MWWYNWPQLGLGSIQFKCMPKFIARPKHLNDPSYYPNSCQDPSYYPNTCQDPNSCQPIILPKPQFLHKWPQPKNVAEGKMKLAIFCHMFGKVLFFLCRRSQIACNRRFHFSLHCTHVLEQPVMNIFSYVIVQGWIFSSTLKTNASSTESVVAISPCFFFHLSWM